MIRSIAAFLLAAVLALPAVAGDSIAFGMKVVAVGDSVAKVYQVAGQPDRVVQLENRYGAGMGERLEYFQGHKAVLITIREGQVTRIEERR